LIFSKKKSNRFPEQKEIFSWKIWNYLKGDI
jgi:hypothetical protein